MLSSRTQVALSTVLMLICIATYASFYLPPYVHSWPTYQPSPTVDVDHVTNIAYPLNPQEVTSRNAQTTHLRWNITLGLRAPDGVMKRVYLINGKFPGPVIEARSGDEIVVDVYNGLADNEGTAIHWHGLSMRGSNGMDGAVDLTQSAILTSEIFRYQFKIENDQAGTFWYHAHSERQRADGLYGAFIIHAAPNSETPEILAHQYDEDLALLIGDWYHQSAERVLDYYTDWTNFGVEPAPDSIILNGAGSFNCSMAVPARPVKCSEVPTPTLRLNKRRARLRVTNTGSISAFSLSMSGHEMQLIQVDGGNDVYNAPLTKSLGFLYPGQRMDLLVERLENFTGNPELTIKLDPENLKFKNFALTPTQKFPIMTSTQVQYAKEGISDESLPSVTFNLEDVVGPKLTAASTPESPRETLLLYTKIEILAQYKHIPKGFINRTTWDPSKFGSQPLLAQDRSVWNDKAYVPVVRAGPDKWVDIVLNNMDDKGHPFHLHGNSFHIMSTYKSKSGVFSGYNPFDPIKGPAGRGGLMNIVNPVERDTVFVPRKGYVIVRLKADNEGLWLLHCHILWHHAVGMAMALQIGGNDGRS